MYRIRDLRIFDITLNRKYFRNNNGRMIYEKSLIRENSVICREAKLSEDKFPRKRYV